MGKIRKKKKKILQNLFAAHRGDCLRQRTAIYVPRVQELLSIECYQAYIGPSLPPSKQRSSREVSRTVEAGLTEGRSRGKVRCRAHITAAPTCKFPEHSAWCDRKNTSRAVPETSSENSVQSAEGRSEQRRQSLTDETALETGVDETQFVLHQHVAVRNNRVGPAKQLAGRIIKVKGPRTLQCVCGWSESLCAR